MDGISYGTQDSDQDSRQVRAYSNAADEAREAWLAALYGDDPAETVRRKAAYDQAFERYLDVTSAHRGR